MEHLDRPSQPVPAEPPAEPVAPRDSATVIVARDGAAGLEVFMLERHLRSDFAGGAYVFPGGTVDDADLDPALADVTDGWSAARAAELSEAGQRHALGFVVCAIRETFEEAGVLLARTAGGAPVRLDEPGWSERRSALAAGEITALELARDAGVRYAADLMRYWMRWITPEYAPRRYDARFFVAHLPEGQEPLHDDVETTASRWIRPADVIAQARAGTFTIIFPTRKTLETVGEQPTARALFDAAVDRPRDPILPTLVFVDGEPRVMLPGDGQEHEP